MSTLRWSDLFAINISTPHFTLLHSLTTLCRTLEEKRIVNTAGLLHRQTVTYFTVGSWRSFNWHPSDSVTYHLFEIISYQCSVISGRNLKQTNFIEPLFCLVLPDSMFLWSSAQQDNSSWSNRTSSVKVAVSCCICYQKEPVSHWNNTLVDLLHQDHTSSNTRMKNCEIDLHEN